MKLRATILGCGSSGGVPRPGGPGGEGLWGNCDPAEPKNRRLRCSLLVQRAHPEKGWDTDELTTLLVDTSPDLRQQLLSTRVTHIDAVLYTHDHADQTHGIDDLRSIAIGMRRQVPVYIDQDTGGELLTRFAYCFETPEGSYYPPILDRQEMPSVGTPFEVDGPSGPIPVRSFLQYHGQVNSLGFLFGEGGIAYSSDVKDMPPESFETIAGCRAWILDTLQRKEHISHSHLAQSLDWLARIKPAQGVLTNLHIDLDYNDLLSECPDGIVPAHDGMVVEVEV